MSATVLVRIRFTAGMVQRLDATAREVSTRIGRPVPRSALVRAAVHLVVDRVAMEQVPGIEELLALDSVRRGRGRAPRSGGAP